MEWSFDDDAHLCGPLVIKTRSRTVITFSRTTTYDVELILNRANEVKLPIRYLDGIEEIRFTRLIGDHGSYRGGKILINVPKETSYKIDDVIFKTFVHEIAHHLDEQEAISSDPDIIEERENLKKKLGKIFYDKWSTKSNDEFVAVGFEYFYGTSEERKKLRILTNKLYRRIMMTHRKYLRNI